MPRISITQIAVELPSCALSAVSVINSTTGSWVELAENAEIAMRASVKTVVLTQFIHLLDNLGVLKQLATKVKTVFSGNIIIDRDLMELSLNLEYPHQID